MKLQMQRETLAKLNRNANEMPELVAQVWHSNGSKCNK